MAGRKKKPTNLKVVQGTFRKDRSNPNEPKPEPVKKVPPPPAWLDEEGRKEWKRVAKELFNMGLLTPVDMTALEAYCTVYSRWKKAEEDIDKTGITFTYINREGVEMRRKNPSIAIADESMKLMRSFLSEFGMTPSSRSKVSSTSSGDNDPLDVFLNRGKKKT
ncbi:MAG: phage terminase small subunit P27 family [Rickettsiales bacterium]|nr:phage terminase small subunit P27 family [Pseudomonadota bacterium]MDA0966871.1 phage terminase small subunit P27 family [Pseudomonadota bacterium]MDG4543546.1 phage terminase small subunit P27 family [Rickettsiales bacterium]MDG4545694.1 phage terminase small subunit P27 family [Rickettsiales bacterium]MDG4547533.1 phage terminase small subunit P27 family [Rickettsiales bacterium]